MRKLLTVTLALMLVLGLSGLALATNSGWVDQNAGTWCKEKVQQFGSNCQLFGALPGLGGVGGGPDGSKPAHQMSVNASCEVDIYQGGNNDTIGLYQDGTDYNYAWIDQSGGNNSLYVYQDNNNGYCRVDVVQTGHDSYSTRQIAGSGYCDLYVRQ